MSLSSYVRVAGRYELGEVIAVGGFGEVWRATDQREPQPGHREQKRHWEWERRGGR